MSDPHAHAAPHSAQNAAGHALIRQLRFLAAMIVSALVFWHFGPWAVPLPDPRGPISLLLVDQGVVSMAELLALAVVVSGLAVAICGAGSAERGPLAVAVGLATLGLHGAQMDNLVMSRISSPRAEQVTADPFPAWGLLAETCLWLALIAVGVVVGRWVDSWFEPASRSREARSPLDDLPEYRHSFGTVGVCSLVAYLVVAYGSGSVEYPLLKGQIYFCVWLAFLLGTLVAQWVFPDCSRVWLLAAIAIVAGAAYLFGGPDVRVLDSAKETGAYVTLPLVSRPLPIEYAAVGSIGALMEQDALTFLRALFGLRPPENERAPARPRA